MCDQLAEEYTKIRCFHQENQGVSAARNHGLDEAKGDYVWFFDSDDLVDAGSMLRVAQIVEEYQPEMLIFGMRFEFYNSKGKLLRQWELYDEHEGIFTQEKLSPCYQELFHNNALSSACNKLFRRQTLNGLRFCEELFVMEDYHFSLSALKRCNTVYLLPDPIYRYIHVQTKSGDGVEHEKTRAARIEDPGEYIKPFEPLLADQPRLLLDLYFMLLRQKLGTQDPEGIEKSAQQFASSKYSSKTFSSSCSLSQKELAERLLAGQYDELYRQMKSDRRRQKTREMIRSGLLYRLIKGTKPKRVRF